VKLHNAFLCLMLALAANSARAGDCRLKQFASLDVLENKAGAIVPVTIQGRSGAYLQLELDDIISAVSDEAVRKYGLQRDAVRKGVSINVENQQIRDMTKLDIGLGHATVKAYATVVPNYPADDPRVVGHLAMDALSRYDVELDFAHGKLNLFSHDHCKGEVVYWAATAPVAAVPMDVRGDLEFVVPMQLDGKPLNAELSAEPAAVLNGKIAKDEYGLENARGAHTFDTISVAGLSIANPTLQIYPDVSGGCNGGAEARANEMFTPRDLQMERCYGHPDLTLGLPQLKRLRIFMAFQERMLYVTAADAR
jgi:hypothetical protein